MFSLLLKLTLAIAAMSVQAMPIFEIGPTESLLKEAMASQSQLSSQIKAFNPAYVDLIVGENFKVSNRLSHTLQNPKVFKEILVNQENAVKKAQFQLATLQSLQTRGHTAVSPALIAEAEAGVEKQKTALASLESIYSTSLADRKSASLLKDANARLTAQDPNTGILNRLSAWKDRLWASRSISAKDKQLAAIEKAQAARMAPAEPLDVAIAAPESPRAGSVASEVHTPRNLFAQSESSLVPPGAPVKAPRGETGMLEGDEVFHDASMNSLPASRAGSLRSIN